MRLKKSQREQLITWIAEGLQTDEINTRAAKFKPRFKVSTRLVAHYRKTRGVKLEEIKEAGETVALTTGLAIKDQRVSILQTLAEKIIADLMPENDAENKRWLPMKKTVGMTVFEYKEFNRAEFDTLRGVLDDIASELGERAPGVQVNNTYHFDVEKWKQDRTQRMKQVASLPED